MLIFSKMEFLCFGPFFGGFFFVLGIELYLNFTVALAEGSLFPTLVLERKCKLISNYCVKLMSSSRINLSSCITSQ